MLYIESFNLTMQNESFEALFNSAGEIDIELKQSGDELLVCEGGKHQIPG